MTAPESADQGVERRDGEQWREWHGDPEPLLGELVSEGYEEYKLELLRGVAHHAPLGGVWQGLNRRTGAVASVVWITQQDQPSRVFLDVTS